MVWAPPWNQTQQPFGRPRTVRPQPPSWAQTLPRPQPVSRQVYNPNDVGLMVSKQKDEISRGLNERLRDMDETFAGTGAIGALGDARGRLQRDASLASAAADRDTRLATIAANADQANKAYGLESESRGQDITSMLGLGNLGVQSQGQQLQRELELAAQGLDWDKATLNANVAGRRDSIDYLLGQLNNATQQRGQEMDYAVEGGRLGLGANQQALDYLLGQLQNETAQRATDIDAETARRGQSISAGVAQRDQDMNYGRGTRADTLNYLLGTRGQDSDMQRSVLSALTQALGLGTQQRGDELGYLASLYGIGSRERQTNSELNQGLIAQLLAAALRG